MMKLDPEIEEILSLQTLGMAGEDEMNRMESLLPDSSLREPVLREFEDLLAESMAFNSLLSLPSLLLRERVMVTTDPGLARVVTDLYGQILDISAKFTDLCGYRIEEVRGRKPGSFLQGPETDPHSAEEFRKAIHAQRPCSVELLNYHKSGSAYWVQIEMSPLFGRSGQLEGYSAIETRLD